MSIAMGVALKGYQGICLMGGPGLALEPGQTYYYLLSALDSLTPLYRFWYTGISWDYEAKRFSLPFLRQGYSKRRALPALEKYPKGTGAQTVLEQTPNLGTKPTFATKSIVAQMQHTISSKAFQRKTPSNRSNILAGIPSRGRTSQCVSIETR